MQNESQSKLSGRWKFIIGGLLILIAVVYLIASATKANAEYFLTVDELSSQESSMVGRSLRLSGAVVGSTISYDPESLILRFDIAHVPADNSAIELGGGLAAVLHAAVIDPARARVIIEYNGPKPDLLRDEAQAIVTGSLDEAGVFHADELLLKCPTKYEEEVPNQVVDGN